MASAADPVTDHIPNPSDPESAESSTPSSRNNPPSESSSRPESPSSTRFRRARWLRSAKAARPLAQSPLIQAITLDHFKAGSSSCPELDQTKVHRSVCLFPRIVSRVTTAARTGAADDAMRRTAHQLETSQLDGRLRPNRSRLPDLYVFETIFAGIVGLQP